MIADVRMVCQMVKQRFEDFWAAEKSITEDIFYGKSAHVHIYTFKEVGFVGEHCDGMAVTGEYNCRTGGMTFNFYLKGFGAVKRFCLGNNRHGDAGRYHEHLIQKDADSNLASNLPYAISRDDLKQLEPEITWRKICTEGKIVHTGVFKDPQEWCK